MKITSKLAKTRVTVCAVKAYTDASTTTPMTTFTKLSIALRTLLCLYSRYVINCLRKVSETTSAPILWRSGNRLVALLDDLLPWFGQRRFRLGARHVTIVVLINKKRLPNDGFQHVRVASTCGVGQKRSQREAPSSAVDTFAWNSIEINKSNFAPKGKVISSPHNTSGADKK